MTSNMVGIQHQTKVSRTGNKAHLPLYHPSQLGCLPFGLCPLRNELQES